jgi:hypothetical protein
MGSHSWNMAQARGKVQKIEVSYQDDKGSARNSLDEIGIVAPSWRKCSRIDGKVAIEYILLPFSHFVLRMAVTLYPDISVHVFFLRSLFWLKILFPSKLMAC